MFNNYLKTALRHLLRHKFYTIMNITGLAIGIACTIMIGLYIQNELSYDKYHQKYKQIYRLESHFWIQDQEDLFAATALPLAVAVKEEFPEVIAYTRFREMDNNLFKVGDKKIFEENVLFADSTVFDIFSHDFVQGTPQGSLSEPFTIVLTEDFANRLFGSANPVGQTVQTGNGMDFTVTGVIEDLPVNSHLTFNGLCSMITLADLIGREQFFSLNPNMFWQIGFYSYILLRDGSDATNILDNSEVFYDKYMRSVGDQLNARFVYMAERLDRIHLHSRLTYDQVSGNLSYIYIFAMVAFLLLLIASINYMNMATASSGKRAKEVGIRKVVGSQRRSLHGQFLIESVLIALLAMGAGFLIAELFLPVFNQISGRSLELTLSDNPLFFLAILGITLLVGLFSGSYPAYYLAAYNPLEVIKGNFRGGISSGILRKVLVLFQFSISIMMLIGVLIVSSQMHYIRSKNLGFNKENLVVLTVRDTLGVRNLSSFRDELLKHPRILKAATTSVIPGEGYGIIVQRIETNEGTMIEKGVNFIFVDHDYLDLMEMEIISGRNFDPEMKTDAEQSCLINEAAVRSFNWGDQALDKRIQFGAGTDGSAVLDTKVIGIVRDFHSRSLHNKIDPLLIMLSDDLQRNIILRIDNVEFRSTIAFIKEKWQEFCPDFPFDFTFLEDNLNELYQAEEKIGMTFTYFCLICIFIACLGLFALAAFTSEQRTKEIGIRKTMGANSTNIVILLSREYTKWVLLANIVAWPIAYLVIAKWLDNFAYRININEKLHLFLLSGLIALIIALLTVVFQSLKAASANPVDALKYE